MTTPVRAKGHTAVMQQRQPTPPDALDYFPTPPWSVRGVLPFLRELDPGFTTAIVEDPACGEGHMAAVLAEESRYVQAFDVYDYGWDWAPIRVGLKALSQRPRVRDFLAGPGEAHRPTWIVTNPPFKAATAFAATAFERAPFVAFLVRQGWLETEERWRLFQARKPYLILQYAERVPMTQARWDPTASTATPYCWVIWTPRFSLRPGFDWIEPGLRKRLTTEQDLEWFAPPREAWGAKPREQWRPEMGPVRWWRFPYRGDAWTGAPTDENWPGVHTHYTPIAGGRDLLGDGGGTRT